MLHIQHLQEALARDHKTSTLLHIVTYVPHRSAVALIRVQRDRGVQSREDVEQSQKLLVLISHVEVSVLRVGLHRRTGTALDSGTAAAAA